MRTILQQQTAQINIKLTNRERRQWERLAELTEARSVSEAVRQAVAEALARAEAQQTGRA